MKTFICTIMWSACMAFTVPVMAATSDNATGVSTLAEINDHDPYVLISQLAERTFARLKAEKATMTTMKARQIINEELLPYIDKKYASYKVMGPNLRNTTKEQKEKFTEAFTSYIVATYADALKKYNDQAVSVEAAKPIDPQATVLPVKVTVQLAPTETAEIIFKMRLNKKTGSWKAYDMVAEGISLLSAKQSELTGLIREKGIDSVTATLHQHVADTAGK